jgi:uncharacterized protein (DUF1499 family)
MLKTFATGALMLVIGGALTHRLGVLPFNISFYSFALGLLLSTFAGLISAAIVFRQLARKQNFGQASVITAACTLPLAMVLATVGLNGFKAPPIHDITTDIHDPPIFSFAQNHREADDNTLDYSGVELADQQMKAYPNLKTLYLPGTSDQAVSAVRMVIEELGWQLLGDADEGRHIEASDVTPIMGFTDDVILRIRPLNEGVLVDMRSVSRVGVGDLGANAKRIRRFVDLLKERY